MLSPKSLMISGEARAKITPSMPSKPQPRPLATAMCIVRGGDPRLVRCGSECRRLAISFFQRAKFGLFHDGAHWRRSFPTAPVGHATRWFV